MKPCPYCNYPQNRPGDRMCRGCQRALLASPRVVVPREPRETTSSKGSAVLVYVCGIGLVLTSWLGILPSAVGWLGFIVSSVGTSLYKARQPSWVKQVGWLVWGVGIVLIIAAFNGSVSVDLAWVGLILTIIGGATNLIDVE